MKKIMTLVAAAMMAVGLHAQTWTPLALGGGWNAGFVGDADIFDYTINKKWAAAEFACNVSSAEYPKYVLEFEEPLPANFQINYTYKASADAEGDATPVYGQAVGDGKTTKFELSFNAQHPYIVTVSVQHTDEVEANLKVKKLTLVGTDGKEKNVLPSLVGWAGADNTIMYKGTVSYNGTWQQLGVKGVEGKSDVAFKVCLAEAKPNVQMCVNYNDKTSEWPGFHGDKEIIFTTKKGKTLKDMGVQYTGEKGTSLSLYVEGVWVSDIEKVKIASSGFSTYAASYPVNYSDCGLKAYSVKLDDSKKTVSFSEIKGVVPANTAVLLNGDANVEYSLYSGVNPVNVDTDLKMSDGTVTSTGSKNVYGLATVNGQDGFYKAPTDKTIPAKCGYLEVTQTAGAAFYSLGDITGNTTGIADVKAETVKADAQMYNLAGQKVGKGYKGIVIKNGKKMIQK
ncbi:hypothetical protein [Segatella copri]|uniref:hypothetical protein n=1 Tax=Segatella copri TaxID=165179 RepID=UPI001933BB01|nr:hypothetical protein [Segatella copri]MBM0142725.1 hypothetical protein [Segatella copri]